LRGEEQLFHLLRSSGYCSCGRTSQGDVRAIDPLQRGARRQANRSNSRQLRTSRVRPKGAGQEVNVDDGPMGADDTKSVRPVRRAGRLPTWAASGARPAREATLPVGLLAPLLVLGAWFVSSTASPLVASVIPSPQAVIAALIARAGDGLLATDLAASLG